MKVFKWLFELVINTEEKKLRGSFVNSFAFLVLYGSFILSMYLIWYSVFTLKHPLADLTTLILGILTAMSTQLSWCFNVWYKHRPEASGDKNGKTRRVKKAEAEEEGGCEGCGEN